MVAGYFLTNIISAGLVESLTVYEVLTYDNVSTYYV